MRLGSKPKKQNDLGAGLEVEPRDATYALAKSTQLENPNRPSGSCAAIKRARPALH